MKLNLDKAYWFEGKRYLPGKEVEVPEGLAQLLGETTKTPSTKGGTVSGEASPTDTGPGSGKIKPKEP